GAAAEIEVAAPGRDVDVLAHDHRRRVAGTARRCTENGRGIGDRIGSAGTGDGSGVERNEHEPERQPERVAERSKGGHRRPPSAPRRGSTASNAKSPEYL